MSRVVPSDGISFIKSSEFDEESDEYDDSPRNKYGDDEDEDEDDDDYRSARTAR